MKKTRFFSLLLLSMAFTFLSCGHNDPYDDYNVNWKGDGFGTLELFNGSNKDIVVFIGQVPSKTSIIGGVMAGKTTTFDISKHVDDFDVGGYVILKGLTREEYENNWLDLSKAKIEFNSMATYRRGTTYRIQIDNKYMGNNGFRVTNRGRIGMELRKDNPQGEKIAYLPALQVNQMVYTEGTGMLTLFPVYVFYNQRTAEVTTLHSTSMFDANTVAPRPLTNEREIPNIAFPADPEAWNRIVGTLKSPVAYITVRNNTSQAAYFTVAGTFRLYSQNGYDGINSGEFLTYEVKSTEDGTETRLLAQLYNGIIEIPIRFEGEDKDPLIVNGYNYTVTFTGSGTEPSGYSAKIVKGSKRDITEDIISL
jgi:hypothetical protein